MKRGNVELKDLISKPHRDPELQRRRDKALEDAKVLTRAPKRKPGKRRGEPNPTELEFAQMFCDAWVGDGSLPNGGPVVTRCAYEAVTFTMYSGSDDEGPARYTPDWSLWNGWTLVACVEVKGSRDAKGARDSISRLKACAQANRSIRFALADKGGGNWNISWL